MPDSPDILVTPRMIQAGLDALFAEVRSFDDATAEQERRALTAAYVAMVRARDGSQ